MSPKILVYGWYNQGNLGDDLFVDAFKNLFPRFEFVFTDHIASSHLKDVDAVFFGGGSFLGESLKVTDPSTFEALKKLKIFYIGVGAETSFSPMHDELLRLAKLVAVRNLRSLDNLKGINDNVILIPDLVYSLPIVSNEQKISKSVLVIPNISVVPLWDDRHWKHVSWDFFKTELSQLLDELVNEGYTINFLPMCINDQLNDHYASIEILNRMKFRSDKWLLNKPSSFNSAIKTLSQYEIIITQRYHGAVLAELAGTPCLTIHHHDKLKNVKGPTLPYYGISKSKLVEEINRTLQLKVANVLPLDRNVFANLTQIVIGLMG